MKFYISISAKDGKRIATLKGFPGLTDACVCALALAPRYSGGFVSVRDSNDNHLCGLDGQYLRSYSLDSLVASAEKNLALVKERKKSARARWKFLMAHGGLDTFTKIQTNETILERFYRNDFTAVEQFLEAKAA